MKNTSASLFYLCTSSGCNRKYKSEASWLKHMKSVHGETPEDIPEKISIVKTASGCQSNRTALVQEVERIRNESKIKRQKMESFSNQIQAKLLKRSNEDECIICMEEYTEKTPRGCCVPCGHAYFCLNCLHSLGKKLCPLCCTKFDSVIKIYI